MADRHVVVVVVALDADIIEGLISIADGILILLFVVVVLLVVRKVDVVVGRVNASAVDGIDVTVSSIINAAVATPPTLIVVMNIIIPFDTMCHVLNDDVSRGME